MRSRQPWLSSAANFPGRQAIQVFLLSPLVVPSIVIGLAILIFAAVLEVRVVEERLVAAHVLITFPYLVRTIIASLSRVDPLAEEAARTLGANAPLAFGHVTLPAVFPGLVAEMVFAFIVSFDNVSISLFLASARTTTLPLSIFSYVETNLDPSVAASLTLLVMFCLVSALLLERMVGLRKVLDSLKMAEVTLTRLTKIYDKTPVLVDASLSLTSGEFLTLLGPSGCGKTTLLRIVAGLIEPNLGPSYRRPRRHGNAGAPARDRHGVSGRCAVSAHDRGAKTSASASRCAGFRIADRRARVIAALTTVRLRISSLYAARASGGQ